MLVKLPRCMVSRGAPPRRSRAPTNGWRCDGLLSDPRHRQPRRRGGPTGPWVVSAAMTGPGPLDGWRVVDLTSIRGALCGRILADLGADVVVAVHPDARAADLETAAHRFRHAAKRGTRLDPADPGDRGRLDGLLTDADVLVEDLGPARQRAVGLVHDAVAARHPHLVHVALTDLGLTGPRASWRLEPLPALAASGALHASGFPTPRPPTPRATSPTTARRSTARWARWRPSSTAARTGLGQLVEVSAQEAGLAGTTPWSVAIEDYLTSTRHLPAAGTRNADGVLLGAAGGRRLGALRHRHPPAVGRVRRPPRLPRRAHRATSGTNRSSAS